MPPATEEPNDDRDLVLIMFEEALTRLGLPWAHETLKPKWYEVLDENSATVTIKKKTLDQER